MRVPYYPGCTLYTKAKNFDTTTRVAAKALGIELVEIPNWTCCGATFPLNEDSAMPLVAPVRNLAYARKEGDMVTTTCAFCYNTLKRANRVVKEDTERRRKINDFIEESYQGDIVVKHLLEVLRDTVGFDRLARQVEGRLGGLRAAPYYGCLLLRPYEEIGLDNPERPSILENFLMNLGCDVVNFPHKTDCCGSYLIVSSAEAAVERSYAVLNSALKRGAEVIVVSCPLCHFNLDQRQREMRRYRGFHEVPILYFTQLLGLALRVDPEQCGFDQHQVDPRPMLRSRNLIS